LTDFKFSDDRLVIEFAERLHRVECELTEIDGEMHLVKTELRKMERFCGLLKLPSMCLQRFRHTDKDNAFPSADVYLPTSTTTVISASTASLSEKKSLDQVRRFTVTNSISVKKKTSDGKRNSVFESLTGSAVEKDLNANLDEVNAMLGTLKHLAVDINVDLSVQLPMIDHITHLVNDNEREIGTSNQRVNRLT